MKMRVLIAVAIAVLVIVIVGGSSRSLRGPETGADIFLDGVLQSRSLSRNRITRTTRTISRSESSSRLPSLPRRRPLDPPSRPPCILPLFVRPALLPFARLDYFCLWWWNGRGLPLATVCTLGRPTPSPSRPRFSNFCYPFLHLPPAGLFEPCTHSASASASQRRPQPFLSVPVCLTPPTQSRVSLSVQPFSPLHILSLPVSLLAKQYFFFDLTGMSTLSRFALCSEVRRTINTRESFFSLESPPYRNDAVGVIRANNVLQPGFVYQHTSLTRIRTFRPGNQSAARDQRPFGRDEAVQCIFASAPALLSARTTR